MFACTNAFIFICTYFIFPETAGRSLEEMDEVFAKSSKTNWYDVVLVERRTPRKYDRHGRPVQTSTDLRTTELGDDRVPHGGQVLPGDDADAEKVGSFDAAAPGEDKKE